MDFLTYLLDKYKQIDVRERRALWIMFAFGYILYSFQSYNLTLGYHSFMGTLQSSLSLANIGRFSADWFGVLTYDQILPIVNIAFPMIALALGSIFIGKILQIPSETKNYVLIGFFLMATPHTISWIFHSGVANYFPLFFIPYGLWLLQTRKKILFIPATLLFTISYGIYQPVVNTVAIFFLGMFVSTLYFEKDGDFIATVKHHAYTIAGVITGLIFYIGIYACYKAFGVIYYEIRMTQLESTSSALLKIPGLLKDSFKYFITPQAYLEMDYRLSVLAICAFAILTIVVIIFKKSKGIRRLTSLALLGISIILFVFSTNLSGPIHVDRLTYVLRYAFYGYVPLVLIAIGFILRSNNVLIKNIGIACVIFAICVSSLNNLKLQRNWQWAYDTELSYIQETITRIRDNANFDPNTKYHLYMVGLPPVHSKYLYYGHPDFPAAQKMFDHKPYHFHEHRTITESMIPDWYTFAVFDFLGARIKFFHSDGFPENITEQTIKKVKGALNSSRIWPNPQSLHIVDNVIIIVWEQEELDSQLELLQKKR